MLDSSFDDDTLTTKSKNEQQTDLSSRRGDIGHDSDSDSNDDTTIRKKRKRQRQVLITGLNQVGLCEEPGENTPIPLPGWQSDWDRPREVIAGRGASFILTKSGQIFSCGHNNYGILGLGHTIPLLTPQRITAPVLVRRVVMQVAAGGFHTLCRTEDDEVYAWGRNDKGQLGIGHESDFIAEPTLVNFPLQTKKMRVIQISAGMNHSVALLQKSVRTRRSQMWSSAVPLTGTLASTTTNQTSPSRHKSISRDNKKEDDDSDLYDTEITRFVYVWGDGSRGQLGAGDVELRCRPQENYWLTKFCQQLQIRIETIVAGGYHNLALVAGSGQIISWGAGDYGQLGHGLQFDERKPRLINQLERVQCLAAGLRHSVAVAESNGSVAEVYVWGCNFWGQLGLGDTAVRLQPTKISAIKTARVIQVSCGDRHTLLCLNHHPMRAKDIPSLTPFFEVLAANNPYLAPADADSAALTHRGGNSITNTSAITNPTLVDYKLLIRNNVQYRSILRALQHQLKIQYPLLDPSFLEDPVIIIPMQAGLTSEELRNDVFEKGLQYCMDTKCDPFDWRRQSLEACFEVIVPPRRLLKSVCLSCARNCLHMYRLRPYIRSRNAKQDVCDCRMSGLCRSLWSPVREQFDTLSVETLSEDGCIAPKYIRILLKRLRTPFPVESADVEEALGHLSDGIEDAESPRIDPVKFEDWYRKHYDEHGDDDPQQHITRYIQAQQQKQREAFAAKKKADIALEEERKAAELARRKKKNGLFFAQFGSSGEKNRNALAAELTAGK
jgi:alpha-tubulin suppressor-like RCC1 family protein